MVSGALQLRAFALHLYASLCSGEACVRVDEAVGGGLALGVEGSGGCVVGALARRKQSDGFSMLRARCARTDVRVLPPLLPCTRESGTEAPTGAS